MQAVSNPSLARKAELSSSRSRVCVYPGIPKTGDRVLATRAVQGCDNTPRRHYLSFTTGSGAGIGSIQHKAMLLEMSCQRSHVSHISSTDKNYLPVTYRARHGMSPH